MRVLAVEPGPNFSVQDVHKGWVGALRGLGVEVADFNLGPRLEFYSRAGVMADGEFRKFTDDDGAVTLAGKALAAACYEYWPDVLLVTSAFFTPPAVLDVVRSRGTKVVIVHTESPYEDDKQAERAQHADLNVLNDPTNIDRFERAMFIGHSYDPAIHRPVPANADYKSDFCFVGTGYPSRAAFFEQVDFDGADVLLAGNWNQLAAESPLRPYVAHPIEQCFANEDAPAVYCSSKVSANIYRRESQRPELAEGWACGPREIEMSACGLFWLRERRGENDDLFPMLPTFDGPEDFGDQLRWWLSHDDERTEAATAARAAVVDRTFENAAKRLLSAL